MPMAKPDLPSSVVRFIGEEQTAISPTFNQIVGIPFVSDWGPMYNEVGDENLGMPDGAQLYTNWIEFQRDYGNSSNVGTDTVFGAFLGMAIEGSGGAGGVVPARFGTAAAAASTLTRQNTTPANAITFTALYKGTRGDQISIAIEDDPQEATRDQLRVMFKGVTVETFRYLATDITGLVAAINTRPSRYIKATLVTTGVALTATTGVSLAGGNDGGSFTATELGAVLTGLEFKNFGILAPAGITTSAMKVQIATWALDQAEEMRPLRVVLGGLSTETVDDVITELNAGGNAVLRHENIIRFGVGTIHDDFTNKDMSTSQLVGRFAGALAARGLRSSLTRAGFAGLRYVTGMPDRADLISGRDQGITMLRRVSSATHELAVSQGVTTFISKTTEGKPYKLFSEPRIIGLFHDFIRHMSAWGDENVIGDLPVTDDTRREVQKEGRTKIDEYESTGLAQPGTGFIQVTNTDNDPSMDDAIPYNFGFKPTRTTNFLLGEGRVS